MCAISGIIGLQPDEMTIKNMLASMRRRGPDSDGVYSKSDCTLLHTRLAIIDPSGGSQPMSCTMYGDEYTIVYNGELYNTEEIRQELIKSGHRFTGHSDTEVVLHAFMQWKEKCLDRMNGIFALGIWNDTTKTLFLARDRIGVKPLFYSVIDDAIIFASEMKTILKSKVMHPILDRDGALQVLMLGPGRKPDSGVFKGIQSLLQGEYLYFCNGKIKRKRYWKLQDAENIDSFEDTAKKVRELVMDAIKRQMVSDVPIGTFLSGGLDSSIISAVCAKEMLKRGEVLKTFSVDYLDNDRFFAPGKFQPTSDTPYISIMQENISSFHQWTVLTPEDLNSVLEDATIARDLPGMADVDFSLLAFCKDIRGEVKVALSGECADEIFGGYPWYRDPEVRMRDGFPWAQNTNQRSELLLSHIATQRDAVEYVNDAYTKTCRESDILADASPEEKRMKQMVNLNFEWFMQTLLDRKDRMSMYHGLEVRVPFCDYRIAQYLYTVPWKYKDYLGKEKGLLRYCVRDLLPKEVLNRKKSPYPKTFDPQYDAIMSRRLQDVIASDSPLFYLISKEKLLEMLEYPRQWPWYGQLMRHAQTCAYFIQLDFWLRHYNISFEF